eukprot:s2479_g7.t1
MPFVVSIGPTQQRAAAVVTERGAAPCTPRAQLNGVAALCAAAATLAGQKARRSWRGRFMARRVKAANVASLEGPKMCIVVFGGTGYIGRAAVLELAARGHKVVVCTRGSSGIGGKQSLQDVQESFAGQGDITVMEADVTDPAALDKLYGSLPEAQGAVCCLASRSGGRQDSFDIDYQATVNCVEASRKAGLQQFVLLSAVCVQRPLLAFQEAKLQAEAELCKEGQEMAYSIVRPTAFFKSLLGQVKGVKGGAPFVMFGDGTEVRCKPISEEDLASFMADCFWDPAKKNQILPVGGPAADTDATNRTAPWPKNMQNDEGRIVDLYLPRKCSEAWQRLWQDRSDSSHESFDPSQRAWRRADEHRTGGRGRPLLRRVLHRFFGRLHPSARGERRVFESAALREGHVELLQVRSESPEPRDSAETEKPWAVASPWTDGPALSFKEQGELLFSLVGQKPNFICVPYGVFDFVQGILDFIAGLIPSQSDLAEYGRIGRYYAEQSMLVLDPATGKYSEELTPSYGRTDLRAFLTDALQAMIVHLNCHFSGSSIDCQVPHRSKGIMGSGASIHEQIQNASQEELQEAMEKMPEEEQQKIKSCLSPEDLAKVEALKCLARENLLRAAADGTLERALQEIKEKHSQSAPPPPPA